MDLRCGLKSAGFKFVIESSVVDSSTTKTKYIVLTLFRINKVWYGLYPDFNDTM